MNTSFVKQVGSGFLAVLLSFVLVFFQPLSAFAADSDSLTAGTVDLQALDEGDQQDEASTLETQANQSIPIYRLYNTYSGEHFYTSNKTERNSLVNAGWFYEGVGWMAPASGDPIYRLYNRGLGDHHYTANVKERDALRKGGWTYEGVAFNSVKSTDGAKKPVYRQCNPKARSGAHNFTLAKNENDALVKAGWRAEGVGWYGYGVSSTFKDDMSPADQRIPIYRLFNMNSAEHLYTSNKVERNNLVNAGWFYEGIGWMAPISGNPVFRLHNRRSGDHHYTISTKERDALRKAGWTYEGVAFNAAKESDNAKKPVYRQWNSRARSGSHNFTLAKNENDTLVKAGWRAEGVGWYAYDVPSTFKDDMQPWKANISGDIALDRQIYLILKSHKNLASCFNYVKNFSYRSGSKFWGGPAVLPKATTVSFAKEMISYHGGNCYRFAALFCWLARGLGYDAQVISGRVASSSGGLVPHGWVEIRHQGRTYVCDPDLAHELPGHNWYWTTYASAPIVYYKW